MIRIRHLVAVVVLATLGAACDSTADDQKKEAAARTEASDKIAAAAREATDKSKAAQLEADRTIAAAEADMRSQRDDYRKKITDNLVALDAKIAVADTKAKDSVGHAHADLADAMKAIHESRATFFTDFKALDQASVKTWEATKTGLDKEWKSLAALVDKV